MKFATKTNKNMVNSVVLLTFSALDGKYPFRVNLVEKIKTACLD